MADPKTKEELLSEIQKSQLDNIYYRQFKEALEKLTEDIDKLMRPSEEGWTLLDEKNYPPLYAKYLDTAKKLNAFLESEEKDEPGEKACREVCREFRRFFAQDMEIMRKYHGEMDREKKSLPTLFEESRVRTVTLYNKKTELRSGATSQRMPMKIQGKDGKEIEGFFTKAVYFKPLETIQDGMNTGLIPPLHRITAGFLTNFTAICRAYFRKNGVREGEEFREFNRHFAPALSYDSHQNWIVSENAWVDQYFECIKGLGKEEVSKITGLEPRSIPGNARELMTVLGKARMAMVASNIGSVWSAQYHLQSAEIKQTTRMDTRNVAMTNVAELLGVPEIVCKSHMMKIRDKDGKETEGVFMEKAVGVDPNRPGAGLGHVTSKQLEKGDRKALKQLADLQVLDYLCGNIDRHGGNIFFDFDEKGQLKGIQGIDNDMSFGTLKNQKNTLGFMMTPNYMKVIPKQTADRIMQLEPAQLGYALYGILDPDEVEAAKTRLQNIKTEIQRSRDLMNQYADPEDLPGDVLLEVKDEEWRTLNVRDLTAVTKSRDARTGMIINTQTIFTEAKETLDDFGHFSKLRVNETNYQSTGVINLATDEGIMSALKKTKEVKAALEEQQGELLEYDEMKEALTKHEELLTKLVNRMKTCRSRVKEDTAGTEEYFKQFVTKDDLDKIRSSEEKLRSFENDTVNEFVGEEPEPVSREERDVLAAHHRKAVEEIVRAIRKNPDSPAAGPDPHNPAARPKAKTQGSAGKKSKSKTNGKQKAKKAKSK